MLLEQAFAKQWLWSVGYYRLSAYWYPYREFTNGTRTVRSDNFMPGTSFDHIAALYEFDRKLRTLIHDGIERIEIGLRTQVNEHLGATEGPLAYRDSRNFRSTFQHAAWLGRAEGRILRARRHNEAIRHHYAYYEGNFPIWVLSEVLDFSDVSMLFEGLPTRAQWTIAENLGIRIEFPSLSANQQRKARREHPLVRWFEHLSIIRNTAAHHSRLWNRSFAPVPTAPFKTLMEFETLPDGQSEKLYGALCMMNVLLSTISPGASWPTKIQHLIEESFNWISGRHIAEMGFPNGWENALLWTR